jgi:hypothetical protein
VVVGPAGPSRDALSNALARGGYSLASVSSNSESEELCRVRPVDLLVALCSDSSSPEILSVAALRDQLPHGHVLVVYENGGPVDGALADASIAAAASTEELLQRVRSLIGPFETAAT